MLREQLVTSQMLKMPRISGIGGWDQTTTIISHNMIEIQSWPTNNGKCNENAPTINRTIEHTVGHSIMVALPSQKSSTKRSEILDEIMFYMLERAKCEEATDKYQEHVLNYCKKIINRHI